MAEQGQVVGDVARAAAALAAHLGDQKGNVDHVQLLEQDVILEIAREDHDLVEGERPGHQHLAIAGNFECRARHGRLLEGDGTAGGRGRAPRTAAAGRPAKDATS